MTVIAIIAVLILIAIFPAIRCVVFHPFATVFYGIKDLYEYIIHKKKNEAPYGQILCYVADNSTSFGCGKTLSATDFEVELYRQYDGKKVWCPQRKMFVIQRIKMLSNVDFLTIPYERLESLSQFVQWTDKVSDVDRENGTLTVTYMMIDEASSQLNSRAFKSNFDPYFIARLLTCRHVRASIILTSQRPGMVDKLMRDCTHMYIGCNKIWRLQRLNYYDAYEMENAQTPALVRPIKRTCWFVKDKSFANYDTYSSVQALRKSCEEGDMLSEEEILALQVNQPTDMDGVQTPSRKWIRRQRQIRRK